MKVTPDYLRKLAACVPFIEPDAGAKETADALRDTASILAQCRAAGFIDADGNVRKVLGTLPFTADGCVVGVFGSRPR